MSWKSAPRLSAAQRTALFGERLQYTGQTYDRLCELSAQDPGLIDRVIVNDVPCAQFDAWWDAQNGHAKQAPNGEGASTNGHADRDAAALGADSSQLQAQPIPGGRFDGPLPAPQRHPDMGKATLSSGEGGRRMRDLGYTVDQVVSMGAEVWTAVREQGIHERDYSRWRAAPDNGVAASGSPLSQPGVLSASPLPTQSSIVVPHMAKVVVTERPAVAKDAFEPVVPRIRIGGATSAQLAEAYPDEERSQAAKDAIARGVPLADIHVHVPTHDIDPQHLQETTDFIRQVLGDELWLAAHPYFSPRGETKERAGRPVCFRTAEDLAAWSLRYGQYNTVYFVTGLLREPLANPDRDHVDHGFWGKSGANIRAAKAVKLEVDIMGSDGEQRFENHVDLYVTAEVFRQQIGIPAPTYIVQTPGGAHFYWALTEVIPIEEIQPYVEALKRACEELDFKVDGTATADRSRVLRLPHTWHRKDPSNLREIVIFGGTRQAYDLEAFQSILSQYGSAPGSSDQSAAGQAERPLQLKWVDRHPNDKRAIIAALKKISPVQYQNWLRVTMALHAIEARELCDAWSSVAPNFEGKVTQADRYGQLDAYAGPLITIATVMAMAKGEAGVVEGELLHDVNSPLDAFLPETSGETFTTRGGAVYRIGQFVSTTAGRFKIVGYDGDADTVLFERGVE
jgi:hypothetical protein